MKQKKSCRQKIRKAILRYFAALNPGQVFYGSALADYCLERAGCKNKYPDTVLRYMRELSDELDENGKPKLSYKCLLKADSLYQKK